MDFIPICTDEYRIAFLQSLKPLDNDVLRIIWNIVLTDIEPPPMPKTPEKIEYKRFTENVLGSSLF